MFKQDKNIMDIAKANSYEDLVITFAKSYFKRGIVKLKNRNDRLVKEILTNNHLAYSKHNEIKPPAIETEFENMDVKNELLEKLLKGNTEYVDTNDEKEEHGKLSFSEKDLSVLMVSQKRAALDVIYNRLAELNQKAVLIHDANGHKKDFYSMVADALENGETGSNKNTKEILKAAEDIDSKIEILESIGEVLHSERGFGITLQEMYSKTKGIITRDDKRYEEFSRFRRKNDFKEVRYNELKDSIEKMQDRDILAFKKYYDLINKNQFIKDINPRMNFIDIDEFSQKIEDIIIPIKNIINSGLEDRETYDGLMKLFEKNSYSLGKEEAERFAVELNKKYNSSLLDKINDGRWWSIGYWISYSKNKKQEEENRKEFYLKEQETKDKVINMFSIKS